MLKHKINPIRPLILPGICIAIVIGLIYVLKDVSPIDKVIISWVQLIPSSWLPEMTFITNAGAPACDIAVAIVWAILELIWHRPRRAITMLGSMVSLPTFYLVKEAVRRARPITDYVHRHGLHDYSFPSGHATTSAAVYGTIAVLALAALPKPYNRILAVLAILFAFLVGVSRIYLGAHFPTDVLGGWLIALALVSILRTLSLVRAKRSGQRTFVDTTEE